MRWEPKYYYSTILYKDTDINYTVYRLVVFLNTHENYEEVAIFGE